MFEERQRERFDFGRVFQRTFQVVGRNLPGFLLLSCVLSGIPAALVSWAELEADNGVAAVVGSVATIVNFVTAYLLQATLVHGAVAELQGRRIGVGEMVRLSVPTLLPVIAASILLSLALVVGFMLLIVPGVIMMTVWAVVIPVVVIEQTGIFDAFTRSRDLTRNHRGSVLGLLIVVAIAAFLLAMLVGFIGGAFGAILGASEGLIGAVAMVVAQVVAAMISSAGAGVIYAELRRAKEGVAPDALSAVFA